MFLGVGREIVMLAQISILCEMFICLIKGFTVIKTTK